MPYSLTLEVYGARVGSSRAPGKLPAGMKNQRLAAFVPKRPARAPRLVPKRLARRLLSGGATVTNDAVLAVMGKRPYMDQKCFQDFNPTSEQAYRDAVAKWVVALLVTCQHVTRVAA